MTNTQLQEQLERVTAERDNLKELLATGKTFSVRVIASEGPAFGAYLAGSAQDGEAQICLNVALCLAVDMDPKKTLSEVMAHEVLHACQEILGAALTEADIQAGLAKVQGMELSLAETDEQAMQELVRENEALKAERDQWRKCTEDLVKAMQMDKVFGVHRIMALSEAMNQFEILQGKQRL